MLFSLLCACWFNPQFASQRWGYALLVSSEAAQSAIQDQVLQNQAAVETILDDTLKAFQ